MMDTSSSLAVLENLVQSKGIGFDSLRGVVAGAFPVLEPVVSLIGDYKSTVGEGGPYPDRGDPNNTSDVFI